MPVFKRLTLHSGTKTGAGRPVYTDLVTVGARRLEADFESRPGFGVEGFENVVAWRTTNVAAFRPANVTPAAFTVDGQTYRLVRREVDGNAVVFYGAVQ